MKQAIAWTALRSGALALHRRRCGGDVILLYHRVVTDASELVDYSPYGVSVTAATFAAQMAFLAGAYDVVALEALARPGPGSRPRCAITFDDGWRDNLTAAWPILQRHGFPVTIFLATNLMTGGAWFWEERLMAHLAHFHQIQGRTGAALQPLRDVREIAATLAVDEGRLPSALAALIGRLRQDEGRRTVVMAAVDQALGDPALAPPAWFLSWDEVRAMASAGATFGGHTASHVNLSRCPDAEAEAEIRACARMLDEQLGAGPGRAFAYPYGKHTPAARHAVAAAGFTLATTTERRLVQAREELFGWPRVDVYEDVAGSVPMFACRIATFMNAY